MEDFFEVKVDDLHRPFIDNLTKEDPETGETYKRVSEVLDCWFESGSMPFAELHYPFDNKEKFEINGEELYNNCISCDFFDKEEKITKTKLKDVFDQIYPGSLFSARFTKKDGEYREIRARFGANTIFGHCVVEDLDIEEEYRTRQVNYNTIQWVISNGVKYIVK